ncbi:hypothetical protein NM688_g5530 [Phlebia brevispora]|uniref:Uncharacterized protein n=1 Tax=Phlebia brevispora TaxID=194682 RepID=A0ACC1STW1_9APHY|nr:hypothetical protein NM688_g5530 [Phlebia brevispora]
MLLGGGHVFRLNKYLLVAILLPFMVSSTYWVIQLTEQLVRVYTFFIEPAKRNNLNLSSYAEMFNAIALINASTHSQSSMALLTGLPIQYLVSDGIVVWRAWVLCKEDYKKALMAPMFFITLTFLSVCATIAVRAASFFSPSFTAAGPDESDSYPLTRAMNICQVSNLVWSLSTNLTATLIISYKAWCHRRTIKAALVNVRERSTTVERIFTLLIETGFLYCASGATSLAMIMVKLPYGTVGDIYTPISLQVAGIYPAIVIVLVGLQRTLDDTMTWGMSKHAVDASSRVAVSSAIRFTREPRVYARSLGEETIDLSADPSTVPTKDDLPSVFYGIHLLLMPFAVHVLVKRRHHAKPNMFVLLAILVPFVLSSGYWGVMFTEQAVRIYVFFLHPEKRHGRNIAAYSTLFNAIALINYFVSDCIVVWRAWVLCQVEYMKMLIIPSFFLALTFVSICATIGIRIATFFTAAGPGASDAHPLIKAINICQVSNLVWTLLTNFCATIIISYKAWTYRQVIQAGLASAPNRSTRVEHIFTLLIETGVFYCLCGGLGLIALLIKLPYGTVGDIYTPVNLQIAGIYPTIVIVLVGLQRAMDSSMNWQISKPSVPSSYRASVSAPIQFTTEVLLYKGSPSEPTLEGLSP